MVSLTAAVDHPVAVVAHAAADVVYVVAGDIAAAGSVAGGTVVGRWAVGNSSGWGCAAGSCSGLDCTAAPTAETTVVAAG